MDKGRLEAFSDGVIAILLTIMVFDLKAPAAASSWESLRALMPTFLCYTLSFLYLAIYWNNHHHLLKACRRLTGGIMWANLHLLFWLSLFPFSTSWLGQHPLDSAPATLSGIILFLAAISYYILQTLIVSGHDPDSHLVEAIGKDTKGRISPVIYLVGIGVAQWHPLAAAATYTLVALLWLVPDRRLEKAYEACMRTRKGEEPVR